MSNLLNKIEPISYILDSNNDPVQRVANIAMVEQTLHDNLNMNSNIQVADTDVSVSNPVPVELVNSSGVEILPATETTLSGINTKIGEVQATPTEFSLLRRLKDLLTGIVLATGSNIIGKVIPVDTDGDEKFTITNPAVVSVSGSNLPKSGQKNVTTAGTQVALGATQVYKELTIIAKSTNTGNIYVGDSTVDSTTGVILPAGGFITLHFVDIVGVYIDSDVNGDGVSFGGDA